MIVSDAQWKYWRNCLKAYLQGKKTMNWIVGVLDISLIKQFDMMIKELLPYGPYPRQGEIREIRRRISEHRFD